MNYFLAICTSLVNKRRMRLSKYLSDHELSLTKFAQDMGVSVETVRRYREGERTPRPEQMAKIKAITAGAVTADDFMPEIAASKNEASAA